MVRYKQTGEVQDLPLPADYSLPQSRLYAAMGHKERALEALRSRIEEGDYFSIAAGHVPGTWDTSDLLGDDPRYQALLEEAGITW